jgi:RNA polymerase sigma factor (sigma-70 family)
VGCVPTCHQTAVARCLKFGMMVRMGPRSADRDSTTGPTNIELLRKTYLENYPRLVRFSSLLTGSRELAEDVAQESFARAALHLSTLAREDPWPYLRATSANIWRNRLRRRTLERKARLERDGDIPDPTLAWVERDNLWRLLQSLSRRQRACLVLRYYEDLPEVEIAQVLGCSQDPSGGIRQGGSPG